VSLNTALQQVSTGKSVSVPSDNPTAAAEMVQNTIETGDVDQYTQNVSSVLSTVQSASSIIELGRHVAHAGRVAWARKAQTAPTQLPDLQALATSGAGDSVHA
jgi:hypothetical protein